MFISMMTVSFLSCPCSTAGTCTAGSRVRRSHAGRWWTGHSTRICVAIAESTAIRSGW